MTGAYRTGQDPGPMMDALSSLVLWNYFARLPNARELFLENGCEWVPNRLLKMVKMRGMARYGVWPGGPLPERPGGIFMRQVGVVAYPEDDLKSVIE